MDPRWAAAFRTIADTPLRLKRSTRRGAGANTVSAAAMSVDVEA